MIGPTCKMVLSTGNNIPPPIHCADALDSRAQDALTRSVRVSQISTASRGASSHPSILSHRARSSKSKTRPNPENEESPHPWAIQLRVSHLPRTWGIRRPKAKGHMMMPDERYGAEKGQATVFPSDPSASLDTSSQLFPPMAGRERIHDAWSRRY